MQESGPARRTRYRNLECGCALEEPVQANLLHELAPSSGVAVEAQGDLAKMI
jgi:hypothetical protein